MDLSNFPPSKNIGWIVQCISHIALKRRMGMGAHVKKTDSKRKDLRPHASERAPIRGADKKESRP